MMVGFSKSVTWMMVAFIMLIVKVGGSKGKALSAVASGQLEREHDEMIQVAGWGGLSAVANDTTTAGFHSCCRPGTATCCTNPKATNGKFQSCERAKEAGCKDCREVAKSHYTRFGIGEVRWLNIYNKALLEWCGATKKSEIDKAWRAKEKQLQEEQKERERAAAAKAQKEKEEAEKKAAAEAAKAAAEAAKAEKKKNK